MTNFLWHCTIFKSADKMTQQLFQFLLHIIDIITDQQNFTMKNMKKVMAVEIIMTYNE